MGVSTLFTDNETFSITLSNPDNATIAAIADGQATGTITNDDGATISIADATVTEGDAGTADAVFTVTLSASSLYTVTVDFATADYTAVAPGDYVSQTGTLTFTPGLTTQWITVAVQGETDIEENETFSITLSNPDNATIAAIADGQATGTITNDDGATISIADATVTEGDAGTADAVFTVTLSASSLYTVTVDFATADHTAIAPGDYLSQTGTLTFTPSITTQRITVAVQGDIVDEHDETLRIHLTNPVSATIADDQAVGLILDDDDYTLTLSADPSSIVADGFATTTVTAMVTFAPDGVTVVLTTSLGTWANGEPIYTTTTSGGAATAVLSAIPASGTVTATIRAAAGLAADTLPVPLQPPPCRDDLVTQWTEYTANPVFDPTTNRAYYPTVIYDADAFGHTVGDVISPSLPQTYTVAPYYKMWVATGSGGAGVQFAYSSDGATWHEFNAGQALPGLDPQGYHNFVLYDPDGFGGTDYKYKIWYWDSGELYDINAIRYAESQDGILWENDQPLTDADAARPIIEASGWNRGSYGPNQVFYNPDGSSTLDDDALWNNKYVMYYNGTDGDHEYIGLGYSADGKAWNRYADEPILPLGPTGAWDSWSISYASIVRISDAEWHMWYSGSAASGTNHGIGYAASTDGLTWRKSVDNPIFHKDDGVAWRDGRTYTPQVLHSAARFDGHGTPVHYKMWFTGRSSAENYAIGYAELGSVGLSLADTSGSGQSGRNLNPLGQPFVVGLRDSCGDPADGITVTFAIVGAPSGASGQGLSVLSGSTDAAGQVSSSLTLGDQPGVYTVTADAAYVLDMPATFTATAINEYTLTVHTVGSGTVDLDPPGGVYTADTVVTLTATPSDTWSFDDWSGDLSGDTNPATLTLTADAAVTATFSPPPPPTYTLTVHTVGSGTVALNPSGGLYPANTVVTLTANPDIGWSFDDWSGDLSGDANPTTLTLTTDATVTATFSQDTPQPCTCPPDGYEGNDSPAEASLLPIGERQTHNFCDAAADWATFTAQTGYVYTITTSSWGQRTDTYLALFDADGETLLVANDDYANATDYSSRVVWKAPAAGTYYVRITNQAGLTGCSTEYDIWIEVRETFALYLPLVARQYSAGTTSGLSGGTTPDDISLAITGIITHTCPDEYEVDDTWQQAQPIEPGMTQAHSFDSDPAHYAADKDFVRFSASAGKTITFTIPAITNTQTVLELYDEVGAALNVTGTTRLVWTPSVGGNYYLSVRPQDGIETFGCREQTGYALRLEVEKTYTLYLPLVNRNF